MADKWIYIDLPINHKQIHCKTIVQKRVQKQVGNIFFMNAKVVAITQSQLLQPWRVTTETGQRLIGSMLSWGEKTMNLNNILGNDFLYII